MNYFSDDFLLEPSLSFEARSLFMLISSLSGENAEMYAPSTVILSAATGWDRHKVEEYGKELIQANYVQEIAGEDTRYALLHQKIVPLSAVSQPVNRPALPGVTEKVGSCRDLLSQDEISALLNGFDLAGNY